MPEYGEVLYNINTAYVAALDLDDNTYGTPVRFHYMEQFEFEFEADEDEIKSGGMVVDKLSITNKATGKITNASMNMAAMLVMYGLQSSTSGSGDTEMTEMDFLVGGEGNGWFGMIMRAEAKNGANALIGFPKCMMSGLPPFQMGQNEFRRAEMDWEAIAGDEAIRKIMRLRRYKTANNVPTTAEGFDLYFDGFFS